MWQDNWFLSLRPDEKLVWIFLLTNEYSHISGLFELPRPLMRSLTGIDDWEAILSDFVGAKKILYGDGWVYILNKSKHQPVSNNAKDNVNLSIKRHLEQNKVILDKLKGFSEAPCKGLKLNKQPLPEVEIEVKVEQEDEVEVEHEVEEGATSSNINKVLDIVYRKSGGKEVFGNPFTREDATKLLNQFGYDEVISMAEFAIAQQGSSEYFPTVDTIGDLLSKWPKLVRAREKSEKKVELSGNDERFLKLYPEMRDKLTNGK
jgi:hypothetical protein